MGKLRPRENVWPQVIQVLNSKAGTESRSMLALMHYSFKLRYIYIQQNSTTVSEKYDQFWQ